MKIQAKLRSRLRLLIKYVLHGKAVLEILRESVWDGLRHCRFSAPEDHLSELSRQPSNLRTQLIKDYHRIEKGLSLGNPRRPFGDSAQKRLHRDVRRLEALNAHPELVATGKRALADLWSWNTFHERDELASVQVVEPVQTVAKREIFEEFFLSRRSVRSFGGAPVSRTSIERAVSWAIRSPSVCNRQSWHVHAIDNTATIQSLLALQNGCDGFKHEVKMLLILSVDASLFAGAGERNQRWIDGGIFSMSIAWALHALGLSTCMLNWSRSNSETQDLRDRLGLSSNYDVIMMIAVGYAPERYFVAASPRKPLQDTLTWWT